MSSGHDTSVAVSVIVPSCNRADMLRRCLTALATQSHPNYEVVVIDDGSTDDTPSVLATFVAQFPGLRLLLLRNETNLGANPSRNRGIRETSAPLVALIDSDCLAEPQWLTSLTEPFGASGVGAVVGHVEDAPPQNIYDLAAQGTHRVPGPKANRLIGGNMCVRRELLLRYRLDEDRATQNYRPDGSVDTTVSARGDEEGLFLLLQADGYELLVAPNATVHHHHHYGRRSYFRQAYRSGKSAARIVYKYYLPTRLDLAPWLLTYVSAPLVLIHFWWGAVPLLCACAGVTAIVYNELWRKGKSVRQLLKVFPVLLVYYQVRLAGYVTESVRLRCGGGQIQRRRLVHQTRAKES